MAATEAQVLAAVDLMPAAFSFSTCRRPGRLAALARLAAHPPLAGHRCWCSPTTTA